MTTAGLNAAEWITRGDLVGVLDACGRHFRKRVLGPVVPGHNFPVVWLCSEEEWDAARAERREPDGRPWPIEDVESAASAVAEEETR